jgi:NADH-quinone oxidoreductase subunit E
MAGTTPTDEIIRSMQAVEAEWTRAGRSLAAAMPKEMAGAFNLMAHPAAFVSASTIVGMGVASQAAGLWLGVWMGAAESVQRAMAAPMGTEAGQASQQASKRARAAMDTLIADAQSLADEVAKPAARAAAPAPVKVARKAVAAKSIARKRPAEPAKETAVTAASAMPVAMSKPANPDDLKLIGGVGPKLEQVLNGLGIWTYGQIAALTPAEIDWIEDYLSFRGRIGRDDWLGQASSLAAGKGA